MLAVSPTVSSSNGNGSHQAYKALFGRIVAGREAAYINTFRVSADEVNDPDGRQDRRLRAIVSAHTSGFSTATAHLSVKLMLPAVVNGAATLTFNPLYGLVSVYRQSVSRQAHGLPKNLSDRKSGKKRRRPPVKKSNRWGRLYLET